MGNKIGRAIKSRRGSNLGESDVHVHGFGSVVDSAIRTASNAGTDVYSFSETVDNPMRSSGAPNNLHVHVSDFGSVVDSAIRTASNAGTAVYSFSETVDNPMRSSGAPNNLHVHVSDFGSVVDSAIRTASNAGTAVYSFAEAVDNPMRSSGAPNNRHVHVHGFDWVVDNAMRSSGIDESVHGFASAVDNGIMSSNLEVSASALVDVHNLSPNGSGWQKGDFLGNGSFGTVYEGFTDDGNFFAVKEVSLLDDRSQGKQSIFQLQQEISLLSQLRHDNIVRYLGTEQDNYKLYIFLELVTKGSLRSLYQKYRLTDSQASAYTRQILSGLKYLHDRNVIHRDIKCAIYWLMQMVPSSLQILVWQRQPSRMMLNQLEAPRTGWPLRVVKLRKHGYGLAADIWSLGCTVLEMLTCQPPYSHLGKMEALSLIGKGHPPPLPESLSTDARDFILKCLQVNPNKRPTAAQLLDHPFLKRIS
uniref:mitogen-activated protein kinase kinase kinase n=1 Tax=Glycine max TaxID=3847 RepID=A0A0R0FW78_SOYBN